MVRAKLRLVSPYVYLVIYRPKDFLIIFVIINSLTFTHIPLKLLKNLADFKIWPIDIKSVIVYNRYWATEYLDTSAVWLLFNGFSAISDSAFFQITVDKLKKEENYVRYLLVYGSTFGVPTFLNFLDMDDNECSKKYASQNCAFSRKPVDVQKHCITPRKNRSTPLFLLETQPWSKGWSFPWSVDHKINM